MAIYSLGIVIPTRNEARNLPRLLSNLLRENLTPDQIVVADIGSSDNTADVARLLGVRVLTDPGTRSDRINLGVMQTSADFVLILDADMEIESGLIRELEDLFRNGHECVIIPEKSIARGPLSRARAFERSLYSNDPAIEAARGLSIRLFWKAGGFNAAMADGCEDWEFGKRAAALCAPVHSHKRIIHYELDLTPVTIFRKYSEYGKGFYALFKANHKMFFEHANPIRKSVLTQWRILLANPRQLLTLIYFKTLVWLSGLVGFLSAMAEDRRRRQLERR